MHTTQGSVMGILARIRWACSDSWTIAHRNLIRLVGEPAEVVLGLLIPIMMIVAFGYVLGSAMAIPGAAAGAGGYREYLVPGMFVMTMLYGVASTATGVALDSQRGVIDRFRSMPTASSAVVVGRCIADMLRALVDVVLLVGCGLLVGWQWHNGLSQALAAVGLLLLLRLALTWIGIYLGLVVPNPDSAGLTVYPLTFPLTVLSSAYIPPSMMPGWLGVIAEWNPISATIFAIRALFGNPGGGGESWVGQHAILLAVLWPLLLLTIFVPLTIRRYQRMRR
jgi:ABC-2 type transport system permease protein